MSVTVIKQTSNTTNNKQQAYYAYSKATNLYAPNEVQATQAANIQSLLPKLNMYKTYINARKKFIALKFCISYVHMLGVVAYTKTQLEAANITATIVETETGLVIRF